MTEVIAVDGIDYDVYATIEDADAYLGAAYHADSWRALTDDDVKGMLLVTATRTLGRQTWLGSKTVSTQPLAWPRSETGVTGVTDTVVPEDIINASIELALAILDGSTVQDDQNTAQKIQTLKAGSVGLTYFREAEGKPLRFPLIVWELVKKYLGSAIMIVGASSSGTDGVSVTDTDFGRSGPL